MIKVSVIIPLYNAEKYIGTCLDTLLAQTFKEFEVLIVDDCSTDSSPEIVDSYLKRFVGRLKIITLPQNSGSGAVPRNVGLEYASGNYVYFMDNDDLLIDNALETLYNFAETYQAEVVYMEKFFTCDEEPLPKNFELTVWCYTDSFVEEPTFETTDFNERIKKFLTSKFCWTPWSKFLRRDFLIDNKIILPPMTIADDVIHTFELVCLAKKWLRVPTPLYVNRTNTNSITRCTRSPEQIITFRTSPLINGLECLNEFMRGLEYFRKNPIIRLQVLNFFTLMQIDNMADALNSLEPEDVYEIFWSEFSGAGSTQPALIAQLLLMNNLYRNELMKK